MKNIKTGVYVYNGENHNFNFTTNLSMAEKAGFVNSVVDIVVDDLNRKYNFILKDLIFDFYVIKFFTDIDVTVFETSSSFVDDVEQFLEETNIVDIVKANAFPTLFDELNKAIDNSIEYITGIHPSPIADAISSLLSAFEKKIEEFDMNSAMEMAQKFVGMTDEFNLDNIVNAYMNSDLHKKNLEEIAKTKKNSKGKKSKKNEIKIDESLGEVVRTIVEENKAEKAEVVENVE